jgi:hypothetical protein
MDFRGKSVSYHRFLRRKMSGYLDGPLDLTDFIGWWPTVEAQARRIKPLDFWAGWTPRVRDLVIPSGAIVVEGTVLPGLYLRRISRRLSSPHASALG